MFFLQKVTNQLYSVGKEEVFDAVRRAL